MGKIIDFNFEHFKSYFWKHVHPHLEQERKLEEEFMERIERDGIIFNPTQPLHSIDGGKD